MRNKLLFLIILSLPTWVYSNDNIYLKSINWVEKKKDTSLIFSNAYFPDSLSKLPYYNESFTTQYACEVSLYNIEYCECPINWKNKIKYLSDSVFVKQIKGITRNKHFVQFSFLPIIFDKNTDKIKLVKSFTLKVKKTFDSSTSLKKNNYAVHSVLSSGKWVKIKLKQDGVYKLTYDQLKKWFSNPADIRVYGNGGGMLSLNSNVERIDDLHEVAISMNAGSDGVFGEGDYIIFYGQSPHVWHFDTLTNQFRHSHDIFSEYSYYYLSDGLGRGTLITTTSEVPGTPIQINTFNDYAYTESNDVNFFKSGSGWYGDKLTSGVPKQFTFSFPNLDQTEDAYLYFNVVSKSSSNSKFIFSAGSFSKTYDIYGLKSYSNSTKYSVSGNSIDLSVEYSNSGDVDAAGYIDYIGLNVLRNLKFNGAQLQFRNKSILNSGSTIRYNISNANNNCQVWDITDIYSPFIAASHIEGDQLWFTAKSDILRNYIVFNSTSDFLSPVVDGDMGEIPNQDIHGSEIPDLIIVVPNDTAIYRQAKRLADWRVAHDGLKVLLVTTQQVYNEFSSGKRDVAAIRDMVKMFYDRSTGQNDLISYLLLFGKGTYANHIDKAFNYNLIPTYESAESIDEDNSYVTDDFFGWMNSTNDESQNLIDVGVGRLPVKNSEEAEAVVDKLIRYENPAYDGDWRNILCFIGDDENGNTHIIQADSLAKTIDRKYPGYAVQKIFLDAYVQQKMSVGDRYPDVNLAINNRINNGALIINYTGHGSEVQLAHEDIIDVASIRAWNNKYKLPLFITATCGFSRFDNVNLEEQKVLTSAGEEILLSPNGGGIGLMTTTRLVFADDNFDLNVSFYKYVFNTDENGNFFRLGDVFRLAKNDAINTGSNRLNFTLLGDPSIMLGFPKKHGIETDSIDNLPISDTDTLEALSLVKVKGHFSDSSNFNGKLFVTVFDKADSLVTLANDEDSYVYGFSTRQNIIFKGFVSIENGIFDYSFPVPKDIKYNFGKGKIVYYATDGDINYSSYFSGFIVGGLNEDVEIDYTGPQINLFMNDSNFREGGITNSTPWLYAKIFDEDGINATGSGIGHDITAIIDNNLNQIYVLNDYYRTEINEYKKGTVLFPFSGLENGKHSLKLVAWDIFNNPSDAELDFEVVGEDNMIIKQIYNYPNPMRNETNFVLEHNWPDNEVTIEIRIYSFTGSLVNILKYKGTSSGYRTSPIRWNGLDAGGHVAGKGIYIYKVVMTDKYGYSADNYGKIVIVR